jgi:hypothetical protein
LASPDGEYLPKDIEIAYSYPNVSEAIGPNFTVKADFWRVKLETIPYYNYSKNYIVYYSPIPFVFKVVNDSEIFCSIALFLPDDYKVSSYSYQEIYPGYTVYYAWAGNWKYSPIKTIFTFTGVGTYNIYMESGLGCFNFTIEEYY